MKIQHLQFSNYRSFGNYQNPVTSRIEDLRKLNMVFGDNNSGKSNILKMIDLLFQKKLQRQSVILSEEGESRVLEESGPFWKGSIVDQPFIFHKNNRTHPIAFEVVLDVTDQDIAQSGFVQHQLLLQQYPSNNGSSTVTIKGTITNDGTPGNSIIKLINVDLNGQEAFSDDGTTRNYFTGKGALDGDSQSYESFISIFNDIVLFVDTDRSFSTEDDNSISTALTAKTFKNWLHKLSLDSIGYKKYESFIEFVRKQQVFGKIFRDFDVTFSKQGNEIDIVLNNGSERLPITNYGTGIHQILFLLAILFETKAKIVLIEELELNLSPKTQRELFKVLRNLINEGEVDQVIFTTHSGYFNFRTDFQIYEVTRNVAGVSSIINQSQNRSFFKNKKLH